MRRFKVIVEDADTGVVEFSAVSSSYAVAVEDPEKLAGFTLAMRLLHDTTAELPKLKPLTLPPETKLDGNDLAELLELIEEPK